MPLQRDAAVRTYLEDVFNGHNLQSLDKYMTGDIVSHWLGDEPAWAACLEVSDGQLLRCLS